MHVYQNTCARSFILELARCAEKVRPASRRADKLDADSEMVALWHFGVCRMKRGMPVCMPSLLWYCALARMLLCTDPDGLFVRICIVHYSKRRGISCAIILYFIVLSSMEGEMASTRRYGNAGR